MALSCPENTPRKLEGFAGKSVVLEVKASRLNADVKWLRNGQEIEGSNFVAITENGLLRRLEILSPSPMDSGTYTCDAIDDRLDFQVNILGKAHSQLCISGFVLANVTSLIVFCVILQL